MDKRLAGLIILIFLSIAYLCWQMDSARQPVSAESITALPERTLVELQGIPSYIRKYGDSVSFYVGGIQIRAKSITQVGNNSVAVKGTVSHYQGNDYIEAIELRHAD